VFTGLVEGKGTIARVETRGPSARIAVQSALGRDEALALGESIAIDGCCLSVVSVSGDVAEFDASAETLARTTLGALAAGFAIGALAPGQAEVNLERAAKVGDRLGGHLVSGHVDGVGTLALRRAVGDSAVFEFEAPRALIRYVAEKGSITVSGVSLTVNGVRDDRFDVVIIPITQQVTTFGAMPVGAKVNLEVDLIARYVERIVVARESQS
jgi:riboflavin synthase